MAGVVVVAGGGDDVMGWRAGGEKQYRKRCYEAPSEQRDRYADK